jgi:anti-anti-sigma factor
VAFPDARELPGPDREFAATLIAHAAQAFDRAIHTDARWRIAETLQQALLPGIPPAHDHLALATRYLPAVHDVAAGGDWYDVICLDPRRTALIVGDVVGHGAEAAAVMGQLRSALAAMLQRGDTPAQALDHLNNFATGIPGAWGSSAVCVLLDMPSRTLRYACAGHPPPVLVQPGAERSGGRAVFLDGARGPILGLAARTPARPLFADTDITIDPGTTLVLYTDGLIERRGESLDDGLDRLAGSAAALADQPPEQLLGKLLLAVGLHGDNRDDVAVLAARLLPPRLHQRLPAVPGSIPVLRRAAARWARDAALSDEHLYDVQLVLGEAASNAVEHAYPSVPERAPDPAVDQAGPGPEFEYSVTYRAGGAVEVTVRDFGCWRTPDSDPGWRGRGLALIHGLAREVHVEPTAAGTTITATVPAQPDSSHQSWPEHRPSGAAPGPDHDDDRPATVRATADGVVEIHGDMDVVGVPAIRDQLLSHLGEHARHAGHSRHLTVDLDGVRFVSSVGVRLLLELADSAHTLDLRLRLRYPPESFLARILTVTGLPTHPALTTDVAGNPAAGRPSRPRRPAGHSSAD